MSRRPVVVSGLLIAFTVIAGISIRFAHLGLPAFMVKYGGSALWAMTIYWIASSFLQTWRIGPVVAIAGSIATAVEFFKLYHAPAVEAFRHSSRACFCWVASSPSGTLQFTGLRLRSQRGSTFGCAGFTRSAHESVARRRPASS